MKNRLTDNYKKDKGSNVSNMIELIGTQANENELSYALMKKYNDIDLATGPTLDAHGNNVGLKRGSKSDDEYRKLIKIRIIANLSNGDIPTINKVLKAFMGDDFKGIQEGWSHPIGDPASIVINVGSHAGVIDFEIIKEVKAGGVGIHLATQVNGEEISLIGYSYNYDIPLPITEMFATEEANGISIGEPLNMNGLIFGFDVPLPICGEFYAV